MDFTWIWCCNGRASVRNQDSTRLHLGFAIETEILTSASSVAMFEPIQYQSVAAGQTGPMTQPTSSVDRRFPNHRPWGEGGPCACVSNVKPRAAVAQDAPPKGA